ncbi:MAG: hypothetical protein ABS81_18655 [Pseudonocardia sp. SCN 72-86]|nr:MAG: hypothetical protein ABS81_18655 [Pseudonocardia sp. SCN 72-86]
MRSLTRLLRTRSEVPRSNWWNETVWSPVAVCRPTGIDTSPKVIEPVQIARAMTGLLGGRPWTGAYPQRAGLHTRVGTQGTRSRTR